MDNGKYARYTPEQVEALERLYHECPKPSSTRRQQLIRDCPILCHIEPKQIKVWFQNRRCREKQRNEASCLQSVNRKLSAMEENDRLQKRRRGCRRRARRLRVLPEMEIVSPEMEIVSPEMEIVSPVGYGFCR
ncbi:hypothetical protein SSX86_001227 [Deinandra increscens subsp. villosa]|uniref:Homeobox domain-containing protein n=1 Tax=Deinandra increscens subsp. villosa TaxID=3103831 RepID=A0AAP0DQX2_9ASTR